MAFFILLALVLGFAFGFTAALDLIQMGYWNATPKRVRICEECKLTKWTS